MEMVQQWHVRIEINAPTLNVMGEMFKKKPMFFQDKILLDLRD